MPSDAFWGRVDPAPLVVRQLGCDIPLHARARIAVLGCDTGIDVFAIARRARGDIVGIDIDRAAIAEANAARAILRAAGAVLSGRVSFERANVYAWLRAQPDASVDALIDTVGFHNFLAARNGTPKAAERARKLVREYRRVLHPKRGVWILTVRRRKLRGIPGCECVPNAAEYAAERFRFEHARPIRLREYRTRDRDADDVVHFPAYHTVARPRLG